MNPLKKSGFFAAIAFLMFFIACGGGNNGTPTPPQAGITILPATASVEVGQPRSFTVTPQNASGYDLYAPGAGCVKDGNTVTCTPAAAGTYTITVTAAANSATKQATATLTVRNPEIEVIKNAEAIDEIVYADKSERKTLTFTSTGKWTASITAIRSVSSVASLSVADIVITEAPDDDCDVSPQSGLAGENTIYITCKPNFSGTSRIAEVAIATENGKKIVSLVQKPSPVGVFTTIDHPDAAVSGTVLHGINDRGLIVGVVDSGFFSGKGFLKDGESYTAIDYLGALGVTAAGINYDGHIAGYFNDPGGVHGFLYYDGDVYEKIDYPDTAVTGTQITGINDSGQAMGFFSVSGGTRGFIYDGGDYTLIDPPGSASGGFYYGINNSGRIVGTFRDSAGSDGKFHGFVKDGDSYTLIAHPDAAGETNVFGINDSGQMIGIFSGSDGNIHGFLIDGGRLIEIDHPGAATGSYVMGINNSGRIVGYFYDAAGTMHGFLLEGLVNNDDPAVPSIYISPLDAHVKAGESVTLTVTAWNTGITWPVATEGVFSTNGNQAVFTPPETAGTYEFTVTAAADPAKKATAKITVLPDTEPGVKFTVIKYPGSNDTTIYGTTESGLIWGHFYDSDGGDGYFVKDGDSYTLIEYPVADRTIVNGITKSGLIFGEFSDTEGIWRGFAKNSAGYISIEYPGAVASTSVYGVTESGLIWGRWGGFYTSDSSGVFVKNGDSYTVVEYPGAYETSVYGITESGLIWGGFRLALDDYSYHGFVKTGDEYKRIEYPGTDHAYIGGITESGLIWGDFYDSASEASGVFVKNGDSYTVIEYPGGKPGSTSVRGITESGLIWGSFDDTEGRMRCFVKSGAGYISIDPPAARNVFVQGITNSGLIWGYYRADDDSKYHGFAANSDEYWVLNYPGSVETEIRAVAESGMVMGRFKYADGDSHEFTAEGWIEWVMAR